MFNLLAKKTSGRLINDNAIVATGRVIGVAGVFLINMLLARTLTKADFGTISFLMTTIIIASAAARFGFDRMLMRYIAESKQDEEAGRLLRLLRAIGAMATVSTFVICFASAWLLFLAGDHYTANGESTLIVLTVASIAAMSFLQLSCEALRGYQALTIATLFDAQRSGPLLNLIFCALLLGIRMRASLSTAAVLTAFLSSQIIVLLLAAIALRKRLQQTAAIAARTIVAELAPIPACKTLLGSSAAIAATEVLGTLLALGDIWIAGLVLPCEQVGIWAVSAQATQFITLPLGITNLAVISKIPGMLARRELSNLEQRLRSSATIATIFSLVPTLLLLCAPTAILSLSYGAEYSASALPIMILCIGKLFFVWTGTCGFCLMFTGHERILLINNLVTALIYVGAGIVLARSFGVAGLAVTSCLMTILSNLFNWLAVHRLLGIWTHARLFSYSSKVDA